MTCQLSSQVNIARTFQCLPVSILREKDTGNPLIFFCTDDKDKRIRLKIPYFGKEGIIISCRTGDKSRGLRQGGKQLQNVVGIDLQIHGKNYNLKISTNNIQLTGAKEEKLGQETFEYICNYMNMIQEILDEVKDLPPSFIEDICDHFYEDKALSDELTKFKSYFNMIRDNHEYFKDNENTNHLMPREEYEKILNEIFKDPHIISEPLEPFNIEVRNSFFTHKLGRSNIPLLLLVDFLKTYFDKISFTNIHNAEIKIILHCDTQNACHRFVIFNSGTMRQHSPSSHEEAYEKYCIVMSKIQEFFDQNPED